MVNDETTEGPVQPVAEETVPAEAEVEETAPTEADQEDPEAAGTEEVTAAEAEPAIGEGDDDLICSVCRQPIILEQEYMNATYGPVHAEPCSHQTVSR